MHDGESTTDPPACVGSSFRNAQKQRCFLYEPTWVRRCLSARLRLAPPNAIAHAGAMAGIARNLFTAFAEKNFGREPVRGGANSPSDPEIVSVRSKRTSTNHM